MTYTYGGMFHDKSYFNDRCAGVYCCTVPCGQLYFQFACHKHLQLGQNLLRR